MRHRPRPFLQNPFVIESYYAAVQRTLRASDWAEDLMQETFARALNQRLIIDAAGNRAGGVATTAAADWMEALALEAGVRGRFTTGPVMHRAVIAYSQLDREWRSGRAADNVFPASNIYNPVHGAPFDRSLIPSADKNCRSTRTSSRRARCLPIPSFDAMLAPIFKTIEPEEDELEAARKRVGGPLPETLPVMNWGAYTTHRDPVLSMFAEFAVTNNPKDPNDHVHGHLTLDPRTGKVLSHDRLRIRSGFFYPMHFRLHLEWKNLGTWIVGLAALVMLAALVSGVVMHRRIFRELFTFRPNKQTRRSTLDLHNLTGVVALPFHFVFAFSGLVVFASISHWRQVRGAQRLSRRGRMVLRFFGVFALALSLFICLRADHATMAPLVWVMALAAGALLVAFALAWRPRLLGPLIAWLRTT